MAESGAPATVYFDHAATSWPKPDAVLDAMRAAILDAGGNPGRGAHRLAVAASRTILEARGSVSKLLCVPEPRDLVFTAGCTEGLNLAIKGLLRPGDRVVVSSMEHNAVARPLNMLAAAGVIVDVVRADQYGRIDADVLERVVAQSRTRAVICQHASNVTGSIQPVGDLADIAHAAGALLIVDGAQGAGHMRVDIGALGADVYASSGHKGLLGPQGVGVLYLSPEIEPEELKQGGSGGNSEDPMQPRLRPDRYEAGTSNTPGIAGLGAAARYLAHNGTGIIRLERDLTARMYEGLLGIDGLRVLGPPPGEERAPVLSVVHERIECDRIAFELDRNYGIAVRAGLHCAPWAHESVGTLESGALRFGIGYGLTAEDVDFALAAMRAICG
ncbi:MAG: aminotransferase class V-fold PLP-dependent enzyme [Coriobacteriia bacterium]|nr:aminotransferase class V-fold PLP-dependent enzyme [Coriobacteriia bacterium]MBN2822007.1 aminotransferase class V-fold PLP-dependent enzyme [Coriobacteriia bacterium]